MSKEEQKIIFHDFIQAKILSFKKKVKRLYMDDHKTKITNWFQFEEKKQCKTKFISQTS